MTQAERISTKNNIWNLFTATQQKKKQLNEQKKKRKGTS